MKYLFILFILLLPSITLAAERPKWIDDVGKGCEKKELCTVGEGVSRDAATTSATIALSKIFDNQISSKLQSTLESENSKLNETVSEEIKQITQSALQGVEVTKFHEENGKTYALAVLNKGKAAGTLKKEIDSTDEKMLAMKEDKTTSSLLQLEGMYLKRESLEKRYHFLTGTDLPCPVKYEQIFKNKKEAAKSIIIHLYLDEDEPKAVEQTLATLITKLGYKVTRGKTHNTQATHIITGEVIADKKYIVVDGFEKYSFHVKISAMDSNKVGTGEIDITDVETGRNFSQAHDKAMLKIKEELKEKIVDLKID